MAFSIGQVSVRLERAEEDARRFQVVVQVASLVKPSLKTDVKLDPSNTPTAESLLNAIGFAGGAGAEYLGEKYGDNIDPHDAARDAIRAFGEECKQIAALSAPAIAKVKRLSTVSHAMNSQSREILERIMWCLGKNLPLTPKELTWIDVKIRSLHLDQIN